MTLKALESMSKEVKSTVAPVLLSTMATGYVISVILMGGFGSWRQLIGQAPKIPTNSLYGVN